MTAARVGVIVVNHNTREHLRGCLTAIAEGAATQTVVVDTMSHDGSADLVHREFPAVEVLVTPNRGYGAAANAGLTRIETPYALLLNADTRPAERAPRALEQYLDSRPDVALVGPRIVDRRGRPEITARQFPTPLEILLQESGLHRLRRRGRNEMRERRIDWVLGAAIAVRREALDDVGGFDESYVMYNEEIDLCLRLRAAGWDVRYAPVTTVTHIGGASTSQYRAAMTERYVRSTVALYDRHFTGSQQAQLRVILEGAFALRLLRDHTRLLLAHDSIRREALQTDLAVWRKARAALREASPADER